MRLLKSLKMLSVSLMISASCTAYAVDENTSLLNSIDIPHETFTLDNGLRVIVHTDKKAPVVHIQSWYNVGGKDEPEGRSGFAHLFEHLMFNGSKNYNDDFFKAFHGTGAKAVNGNTTVDRTLYYETVPTNVLERALWLESDRMENLVITQEKLEQQRAVVKNEKLSRIGGALGDLETLLQHRVYPIGHPYHNPAIGSIADLDAAKLEDVQAWYDRYYGASNVVLLLAGDITIEDAKRLVTKYFSDIRPGGYLDHKSSAVPIMPGTVFEEREADITLSEMLRIWAVPGSEEKEAVLLQLVSSYLSEGKTSPFYKKLVEPGHARVANMYVVDRQLASMLKLNVEINPGTSEAEVNRIFETEITKFIEQGPVEKDLQRLKQKTLIQRFQRLDILATKGEMLASGVLYAGDSNHFKTKLKWMQNATAEELQAVAKKWLTRDFYHLSLTAVNKTVKNTAATLDRSLVPEIGPQVKLSLPEMQKARLDNGMQVILAERHTVPFIKMRFLFDAGILSEQNDADGIAIFATQLLKEGSKDYSAKEIQLALDEHGSSLKYRADSDWLMVTATMLKNKAPQTVEVLADILQNPAFDDAAIDKLKTYTSRRISKMQSDVRNLSAKTFMTALYGAEHPFTTPNQGYGTLESISSLTQADLHDYHSKWVTPTNGTIIIVGDTTMDEILPILNDKFANWQAPKSAGKKAKIKANGQKNTHVYLIDRPGAKQTAIKAGHLVSGYNSADSFIFESANKILGSGFVSRLNLNLREDKGWAYGANATVKPSRVERIWQFSSSVQADKTVESIAELIKEVREFQTTRPITEEELSGLVASKNNDLPGRFETSNSVLSTMTKSFKRDQPVDYALSLPEKYNQLTTDAMNASVKKTIQPEKLIWVIVGDLKKIEQDIRALNLGNVTVVKNK